ncbi:ATP-binding protein [Streptomyces phytophilus]|uniref:ATP-binding protein n=1 Tax=Streptomyces phytophilus TaxID=722715 RepID=UPI0015F09EA4|nr:ATP-binding protein [Streptomyces phytophilus]
MTLAAAAAPVTADAPCSYAFEVGCAPDRSRVGCLRQITAAYLALWDLTGSLADDVVVAVSELVSNAVVHGRGDVSLHVRYAAGDLQIEVTDANPVPAELHHAGDDEDSGRGLFLIATLAQDWGVNNGGRTTWCRFRVPTGGP